MKCPFCGHTEDRVVDSRVGRDGEFIRRRRECLKCHRRYTTYEYIEDVLPHVVKRDGRREPFDRQKLRGSIGVCLRDLVGRRHRQVRQRVEGGDLRILGQGGARPLHRLLPPPDPLPVVRRLWVAEEGGRGIDEQSLALGGWAQGGSFLHLVPSAAQLGGPWARGPEWLEERHGDPPMRHGAALVAARHLLEGFSRSGVRHVMQEGDRAIEVRLRRLRTRDGEVDPA